MIRIHPISGNKKQYLDLLLLADEQESMIDRYLERGEMFILSDNDTVKASCVITCVTPGATTSYVQLWYRHFSSYWNI